MNWMNRELPSFEQILKLANSLKMTSIAVMATGAAAIGTVGTYNAVTSDTVIVEPLRVPKVMEEHGFTSEVTTARLLDEITTLGRTQSSSAKERVSILSKARESELEKLSLKGADAKTVQTTIQETLGIQRPRITGEITYAQDEQDKTEAGRTYHIRLRKLPSNQTLLDMQAKGAPQSVLQQTAMRMVEIFDPHIAASIYWRNKDEANALRLIDVVLTNDNPSDDKYSLNLRGYIHVAHKEFDEAQAIFDKLQALDPSFAPAHFLGTLLNLGRKDYIKAMNEAEQLTALEPQKYWGYYAKALVLRDTKKPVEALAMFRQSLSLKPESPNPFIHAATLMKSQSLQSEAVTVVKRGLVQFSSNEALQKLEAELQEKPDNKTNKP